MSLAKDQPQFNRRIFWDINFDNLDYDAKASFIIERVLSVEMCQIFVHAEGTTVTLR